MSAMDSHGMQRRAMACGERRVRRAGGLTGALSERLRLEHTLLARADHERPPRIGALLLGYLPGNEWNGT